MTAALDDLDSATGSDQARVHRVDAVLSKALEHTLDRRRHEQVHVVLSQLALELELDRTDASTEELCVQRREPFGQVCEWTQVGHLLRRQRRRVDGVARQLTRQHRGHLLSHIERDRGLRLDRGRGDVRGGDEVREREKRILAGRLLLEHVHGGGRRAVRFERLIQCGLVDDAAAGRVDQPRRRLHQPQLARSDESAIRFHQRHMHGHEVGALEQLIQRHELDVEELRALHRYDRVVGDDFHLQAVGALGDL